MSDNDESNYYEPNAQRKFEYLTYITERIFDLSKLNILVITAFTAVVSIAVKANVSVSRIFGNIYIRWGMIIWIATLGLIAISFIVLEMVLPTEEPPFIRSGPYKQFYQLPLTPETLYIRSATLKLIMTLTVISVFLFFIGILDAIVGTYLQKDISIVFGLTFSFIIGLIIIMLFFLPVLITAMTILFKYVSNNIFIKIYILYMGIRTQINEKNNRYNELERFEYWILDCLNENGGQTINDLSSELWDDDKRIRQDVENLIENHMINKVDGKRLYLTRRGYASLKKYYNS